MSFEAFRLKMLALNFSEEEIMFLGSLANFLAEGNPVLTSDGTRATMSEMAAEGFDYTTIYTMHFIS